MRAPAWPDLQPLQDCPGPGSKQQPAGPAAICVFLRMKSSVSHPAGPQGRRVAQEHRDLPQAPQNSGAEVTLSRIPPLSGQGVSPRPDGRGAGWVTKDWLERVWGRC